MADAGTQVAAFGGGPPLVSLPPPPPPRGAAFRQNLSASGSDWPARSRVSGSEGGAQPDQLGVPTTFRRPSHGVAEQIQLENAAASQHALAAGFILLVAAALLARFSYSRRLRRTAAPTDERFGPVSPAKSSFWRGLRTSPAPHILRHLRRLRAAASSAIVPLSDRAAARHRPAPPTEMSAFKAQIARRAEAAGTSCDASGGRGGGCRGGGNVGCAPLPPPMLLGSSSDPPTVLSPAQLAHLRAALPARLRALDWRLAFSTDQHGCSLQTFYRRVEHNGPSFIVVLDGSGWSFGAFVSESWRCNAQHYFGTGECFLFKARIGSVQIDVLPLAHTPPFAQIHPHLRGCTLTSAFAHPLQQMHPHFRLFPWTRANSHFVHASSAGVAFGSRASTADASPASAAAHPGLYLDSSFEFGSSAAAHGSTFGNEPLASTVEFRAIKVEAWVFEGVSSRGAD